MTTTPIFRRPVRIRFRFLAIIAVAVVLVYRLWLFPPAQSWLPLTAREGRAPVLDANSTLGFGAIYVVSKADSPRRHGLLQAANVTDIDLTIPSQPKWTEKDFGSPERKSSRGSLLAWLGHLHLLRQFIDSGLESALILEDDVDWDIRLRSLQAPLVSAAMRTVLASRSGSSAKSSWSSDDIDYYSDDAAARYPYGDPSLWDLLYMGHCGDYFHGMDRGFEAGHVRPKDLAAVQHLSFNDTSLPDFDNLHPWTASLLTNLGVPVHTRLVHRSIFPLCTFAYAVTRHSARRLVEELASLERTDHAAYDVAILISCREGGLRCWSVNPELFHHQPGKSMIAGIDNSTHLPPVDAKAKDQVELRGETPNIDCGFWDGAFAFDDGDDKTLKYLQKEVGRKGRCLKPGRELPR
ncbi:glycosyltransferase family 25 protein [Echria macrotheca]|uniref:Glycosyltransferase family 25 protein n=1 Tax=Echria macrotheca TaxID=438768 RepID=A0AAJ0BGJ5_9PEZI|nr:glycosyltransferase family 25 protein [Echria macrotheca]